MVLYHPERLILTRRTLLKIPENINQATNTRQIKNARVTRYIDRITRKISQRVPE
jgi:hypothetical protein